MKRLALVIAAFAAAPALAQPPSGMDSAKPVAGFDASAPVESEEELARRWERQQAIYALRQLPDVIPIVAVSAVDIPDALATPLPPQCEPPMSRASSAPGPPKPPAPCSPLK